MPRKLPVVACSGRFAFKRHKGGLTPVFRAVGRCRGDTAGPTPIVLPGRLDDKDWFAGWVREWYRLPLVLSQSSSLINDNRFLIGLAKQSPVAPSFSSVDAGQM